MCLGNCSNSIVIGYNSGVYNNANENIFVGIESGYNNVSGYNNIFMGSKSGYKNTVGINNIGLGNGSLCSISTIYDNNNICIGYNSGYSINGSNNNIFVGSNSGSSLTIGSNNIAVGGDALKNCTIGFNNICVGKGSGPSITTGQNNISLGTNVFANNTTGSGNIAIGSDSLALAISGNYNIAIGFQVLSNLQNTSSYNVSVGYQSLTCSASGSNNLAFGYFAGNAALGSNNMHFGTESGRYTAGINNTFIGNQSGFFNYINNNNTYIGNKVGQGNNGSNNFFLGYETGNYTGEGVDIYGLGPSNVNAYYNYYAGFNTITTYSNKFAIYQNADKGIVDNTTTNCKILLGGDFTTGTVGVGTIVPNNYIGSNISITTTQLVVLGKILANAYTYFTGSHNVNIDSSVIISDLIEGMIMSTTGIANYCDINNTKVTVTLSTKSNDKAVFGVYCGNEVVNNNTINNKTIYYVNSLGEGGILVTNYGGEIQNGDYIISCPIRGYGCLQDDDIMHSYTVAKCTQNINWSQITNTITYNGTPYLYTIASCTYHCG